MESNILVLQKYSGELRPWSASLPLIINDITARLWNGRQLSRREREYAYLMYVKDGPQAALEWLSEHVW